VEDFDARQVKGIGALALFVAIERFGALALAGHRALAGHAKQPTGFDTRSPGETADCRPLRERRQLLGGRCFCCSYVKKLIA
jgi:hypothetical protein